LLMQTMHAHAWVLWVPFFPSLSLNILPFSLSLSQHSSLLSISQHQLASGSNREASINSLLDQLELLNPARGKWLYGGGEARGGGEEERASSSSRESDSFGSVASGSWRVAFAPHIAKVCGDGDRSELLVFLFPRMPFLLSL